MVPHACVVYNTERLEVRVKIRGDPRSVGVVKVSPSASYDELSVPAKANAKTQADDLSDEIIKRGDLVLRLALFAIPSSVDDAMLFECGGRYLIEFPSHCWVH